MHIKKFLFQELCRLFLIYPVFVPFFLFSDADNQNQISNKLNINLIGKSNGKGLETDQNILKEALERLDCLVTIIDMNEPISNRAHINIFIQGLVQEKMLFAEQNWFIPNPEWFEVPLSLLDKVDLILCRTKEVQRIFRDLNQPTYYMGFTSPDCYRKKIKKDYHHLFHLAGGSDLKGTDTIKNIWLTHPSLPLLTVVNHISPFNSKSSHLEWISKRLPENKLRIFQNRCGIHLCPSEVEGFGHYLVEGLSTAAVVLTTDAPPMNELIKDPRCLVPYIRTTPLNLGTRYEVDPQELKRKIEYLVSLPQKELKMIGQKNRSVYLKRQREFYERLEDLILKNSPLKENK